MLHVSHKADGYGAPSHLHLTRLSRGSSLFTHSRGATANANATATVNGTANVTVKATVFMLPLISFVGVQPSVYLAVGLKSPVQMN